MKNNLKITLATLVASIAAGSMMGMAPKQVSARALPVYYSAQDNQWYGLFTKNFGKNNQPMPHWTDFGKLYDPQEGKANKPAAEALATGTDGQYKPTVKGKLMIDRKFPWEARKINGVTNVFHFVPVKYQNTNVYSFVSDRKADIAWISIQDIVSYTGRSKELNAELRHLIRDTWDKVIEPKLWKILPPVHATPASAPIVAPTPAYQVQPTWLSIGQEKPTTWGNISGALYFYDKKQPYYEFTNFYDAPFTDVDGKVWPTSEHYFQAHKSSIPEIQEHVRTAIKRPREAYEFFRDNPGLKEDHWNDPKYRIEVMNEALSYKFSQNQPLKALLLATGNNILVEDAGKNDTFWGAGADMQGENWLGRLLMQLRTQFQQEAQSQSTFTGAIGKQEQ